MKLFVCAILMLVLMVGGGVVYGITIDRIMGDMIEAGKQIDQAIYAADTQSAADIVASVRNNWERNRFVLSGIIDHTHIYELEITMEEIAHALYSGEEGEALLASARMQVKARNLKKNEHLTLENVL